MPDSTIARQTTKTKAHNEPGHMWLGQSTWGGQYSTRTRRASALTTVENLLVGALLKAVPACCPWNDRPAGLAPLWLAVVEPIFHPPNPLKADAAGSAAETTLEAIGAVVEAVAGLTRDELDVCSSISIATGVVAAAVVDGMSELLRWLCGL